MDTAPPPPLHPGGTRDIPHGGGGGGEGCIHCSSGLAPEVRRPARKGRLPSSEGRKLQQMPCDPCQRDHQRDWWARGLVPEGRFNLHEDDSPLTWQV